MKRIGWLKQKQDEKEAGYSLNEEQVEFIHQAELQNFEIDYNYSGRFMFGRKCPAVRCNKGAFGYNTAAQDSMGLGIVVYMP